jgi:hypothetical protein
MRSLILFSAVFGKIPCRMKFGSEYRMLEERSGDAPANKALAADGARAFFSSNLFPSA